jgi:hypothetical protein
VRTLLGEAHTHYKSNIKKKISMKISISKEELSVVGDLIVAACAEFAKVAPQFMSAAASVVAKKTKILIYTGLGNEYVRFIEVDYDSLTIVYMNNEETLIKLEAGDDIDQLVDNQIIADLIKMGFHKVSVQDPSQEPLPNSYPIKVVRTRPDTVDCENDTVSPQV